MGDGFLVFVFVEIAERSKSVSRAENNAAIIYVYTKLEGLLDYCSKNGGACSHRTSMFVGMMFSNRKRLSRDLQYTSRLITFSGINSAGL